jgi:hypothetical protein
MVTKPDIPANGKYFYEFSRRVVITGWIFGTIVASSQHIRQALIENLAVLHSFVGTGPNGEKTTDAMVAAGCPQPAADQNCGTEWRVTRPL